MDNKSKIAIGGQAVIEGVMMRGPEFIATAIRKKDNSILIKKEKFVSITKRNKFLGLPVIRGFVSLIEMLIIGFKSLSFSAEEAVKDEEKESDNEKKKKSSKFEKLYEVLSFVLAFGLAFLFFVFLPYRIAYWLNIEKTNFTFNIVKGLIQIFFFITYIFIISFLKDIKRLFEFHGAEHKSVFAYEEKQNFEMEDTLKFSTHHPRCGTSFIFIVLIIAILVFSIFDTLIGAIFHTTLPLWLRILLHILLMPFISGISYEILKYSGKNINNWLVRIFSAPGLAFQRITTKEPDEEQLEVAICALKAAVEIPVDYPNVEFFNQTIHE